MARGGFATYTRGRPASLHDAIADVELFDVTGTVCASFAELMWTPTNRPEGKLFATSRELLFVPDTISVRNCPHIPWSRIIDLSTSPAGRNALITVMLDNTRVDFGTSARMAAYVRELWQWSVGQRGGYGPTGFTRQIWPATVPDAALRAHLDSLHPAVATALLHDTRHHLQSDPAARQQARAGVAARVAAICAEVGESRPEVVMEPALLGWTLAHLEQQWGWQRNELTQVDIAYALLRTVAHSNGVDAVDAQSPTYVRAGYMQRRLADLGRPRSTVPTVWPVAPTREHCLGRRRGVTVWRCVRHDFAVGTAAARPAPR